MKIRRPGLNVHPLERSDTPARGPALQIKLCASIVNTPPAQDNIGRIRLMSLKLLEQAKISRKSLYLGVTVDLAREWPSAHVDTMRLTINPFEARSLIWHALAHEFGHLAHAEDALAYVTGKPQLRAFRAWRHEARRVRTLPTTRAVEWYLSYVVQASERRKVFGMRGAPALWTVGREASIEVVERKESPREHAMARGWDEFLAEAFARRNLKPRLATALMRRREKTLREHFPEALRAYENAIARARSMSRLKRYKLTTIGIYELMGMKLAEFM